jgi:hypothetical protein
MIGWQINDADKQTTSIHTLGGIQIHDLSVQEIKTYASDRAVTGTGSEELTDSI